MDKLCCRIGVRFKKQDAPKHSNNQQRQPKSFMPSAANERPSVTTQTSKKRLATLAQIGEDWLYLALLGIIMALLSFSMDTAIAFFLNTRLWLFRDLSEASIFIQYLGWCVTPIVLVTFSSGFVHICSPTAIGSGIPEMKTILRGVVLNEYLTFRTLIAKIVGLTFTLSSGLPLGKEGPFVHMASIVATLLSKLVASFQGIYENESRTSEMLSAACAVGVAATFYAPIGGVLFSIEVTTVYFAVRNYWRGFFAACCGATIWRLLGFWIKNDESISALFKTNFNTDYPFDPIELLVFSFVGISSGLAGAAYIKFHREIVQFFRRHERISGFLQKNRFVYPIMVTLIITTVTFPPFIGKYTASTLSTHTTIEHLFSNRTWSLGNQDLVSKKILDEWTTPDTNFHLHLILYIAMLFWTSALASTIPIPSGLFIPVLKMGAAYGRLLGELMHLAYPNGIKYGDYVHPASIVPGSYAVVGAAAFSGAVTHTISTSVILFEMTGQIVHIIPVILGVLISNAVCQSLQPSIYDSIIEIKKLPYLPPIASSNSVSHKILVKDFMNTNLAFIWKEKCSYASLKLLLTTHNKIISFPLVESSQSMKLLGSVPRPDLLKLLYLHLGRERRLQEVCRRNSDTLAPAIHLLNTIEGRLTAEEQTEQNSLEARYNSEPPGVDLEFELRRSKRNKMTINSNSSDSCSSSNDKQAIAGIPLVVDIPSNNTLVNYGAILKPAISKLSIVSDTKQQHSKDLPVVIIFQSNSNSKEDENDGKCKGEEEVPSCVAKIINHYDRGSSVDEDQLEKSTQEVESYLADINKSKEIVVFPIELSKDKAPTSTIECLSASDSEVSRSSIKTENEQIISMINLNLQAPKTNSNLPLTGLVELKPLSSFNLAQQNQNPCAVSRPTKSILKSSSTTNSFNNMYKRNISSQSFLSNLGALDGKQFGQPYNDEHRKLSTRPGGANFTLGDGCSSSFDITHVKQRRKVRLPKMRVVDMTPEEQEQWEKEQLNAYIDISRCQIDEAPFQLVEQTSLYRVHTLFSMLGLNHAYVTSFGRLVGIVALKDIRYAIEKMLQEN